MSKVSLRLVLITIFITFMFRSCVVDTHKVPSSSMEPTIFPGQYVIVDKLAYGLRIPFTEIYVARWNSPKPGDVVSLSSPTGEMSANWVKRVVATENSTVLMSNKHLFVNGQEFQCKGVRKIDSASGIVCNEISTNGVDYRVRWSAEPNVIGDNFGPYNTNENEVYVLGDNRNVTMPVPPLNNDKILGKVVFIGESYDLFHLMFFAFFIFLSAIILFLLIFCEGFFRKPSISQSEYK